MCGRFAATSPGDELAAMFKVQTPGHHLGANYNVSPATDVYGVCIDNGGEEQAFERKIEVFSWGLTAKWSQPNSRQKRLINARAETVDTKTSFAQAFRSRRCIIPADGFYEWKATDASDGKKVAKQPMYIFRSDREILCMAGIWESRPEQSGETQTISFAILTTAANRFMSDIHDRMPVVLPQSAWDEWLDPRNSDVARLKQMLLPAPGALFEAHPVDAKVGNPRNNGPELIAPLA